MVVNKNILIKKRKKWTWCKFREKSIPRMWW